MATTDIEPSELTKWDPGLTERVMGIMRPFLKRYFRSETEIGNQRHGKNVGEHDNKDLRDGRDLHGVLERKPERAALHDAPEIFQPDKMHVLAGDCRSTRCSRAIAETENRPEERYRGSRVPAWRATASDRCRRNVTGEPTGRVLPLARRMSGVGSSWRLRSRAAA